MVVRHESPARVAPDPAVAGDLADIVEDASTFYALAGQKRNESKVLREGVRTLEDVDATRLLVSLLDQGWTLNQSLRAAWNVAEADHAGLMAFLLRDRGMSLPEVTHALAMLGVSPAEQRSLIQLLDIGR